MPKPEEAELPCGGSLPGTAYAGTQAEVLGHGFSRGRGVDQEISHTQSPSGIIQETVPFSTPGSSGQRETVAPVPHGKLSFKNSHSGAQVITNQFGCSLKVVSFSPFSFFLLPRKRNSRLKKHHFHSPIVFLNKDMAQGRTGHYLHVGPEKMAQSRGSCLGSHSA